MKNKSIQRFYWLDILRGIAALSVVLWHWQHFFFDGSLADIGEKVIDRTQYPLYSFLRPFYGQGWRAVELFFTLSGFIFYWLYADQITKHKINFSNYLILRLSRLYPLHLLTLLVVIGGQIWYHYLSTSYFVYNKYSIVDFVSNLTLTASWFSSDFSFNGPVWSVSVELLLYLFFFTACTFKYNKMWHAGVLIIAGLYLKETFLDSLGTGLMSFFMGGITYYCYNWLNANLGGKGRISFVLVVLPIVISTALLYRYIFKLELPLYFYELCLFPLIILSIALAEASINSNIGKQLAFIGDISYSSYLWHFPLQLAFMLAVRLLNLTNSVFYSPQTLAIFYILLIIISLLSFHYFERPAQKFLRNWWRTAIGIQTMSEKTKVA